MGACSSKPKTTEFEGSTEPVKQSEGAVADRSIDAVDAAQLAQKNEPVKQEVGSADADVKASTDAGVNTSQETRELIARKDQEPLTKGLVITEEGVSHSVNAETVAVDGDTGDSTAEVDTEDLPKVDEGVSKEVSDKGTSVDYSEGVSKAASDKGTAADYSEGGGQDKLFEDKAVISDETNVVGVGDDYIDKGVAVDHEKAHDSGGGTMQEEQSRNLQEVNESPGAESPIIGVVQPADPAQVDDVSESVGLATIETPAHVDSSVGESPAETERDVATGTNTGGVGMSSTEEPANVSSGLSQAMCKENEEAVHTDSKASPLVVSVLHGGVGQESGADHTRSNEVPLGSVDAQDVISTEDTTKSETVDDPQMDIDERTSEPQGENASERKEAHVEVRKNEGNTEFIDQSKQESLKAIEGIEAETTPEGKAEPTTQQEAIRGQDEGTVDEPVSNEVLPQTLAVEEPSEAGKPEATPDGAVAEPSADYESNLKFEEPHIEGAATNKGNVESVDAGNHELTVERAKNGSGEGDVAFEDASDVPLKAESGNIESGDTPKS